ncbi:hypothetical protein PV726_31085 [Streptomyces europaeiscabiei]|uniref:hypothetical protein n=1 Tax=Streptomyces europaeiscabiei TaxID=146819 RepID=UPI0029A48996|nr:hypothetical protein [Streptomyces europaeiscabiei]MDX3694698.1 hypothetical protein [Streptomyces europaeiscabiei]
MREGDSVLLVALDCGDCIHVVEEDEHGRQIGLVEQFIMDGSRDDTLKKAGYRTTGEWTLHGDEQGATVERTLRVVSVLGEGFRQ